MYHRYVIHALSVVHSPSGDEHDVPLNAIFCEGVCASLVIISTNSPRGDGIEAFQPGIDEFWISVCVGIGRTPVRWGAGHEVCTPGRRVSEEGRQGADLSWCVIAAIEAETFEKGPN